MQFCRRQINSHLLGAKKKHPARKKVLSAFLAKRIELFATYILNLLRLVAQLFSDLCNFTVTNLDSLGRKIGLPFLWRRETRLTSWPLERRLGRAKNASRRCGSSSSSRTDASADNATI